MSKGLRITALILCHQRARAYSPEWRKPASDEKKGRERREAAGQRKRISAQGASGSRAGVSACSRNNHSRVRIVFGAPKRVYTHPGCRVVCAAVSRPILLEVRLRACGYILTSEILWYIDRIYLGYFTTCGEFRNPSELYSLEVLHGCT